MNKVSLDLSKKKKKPFRLLDTFPSLNDSDKKASIPNAACQQDVRFAFVCSVDEMFRSVVLRTSNSVSYFSLIYPVSQSRSKAKVIALIDYEQSREQNNT